MALGEQARRGGGGAAAGGAGGRNPETDSDRGEAGETDQAGHEEPADRIWEESRGRRSNNLHDKERILREEAEAALMYSLLFGKNKMELGKNEIEMNVMGCTIRCKIQ